MKLMIFDRSNLAYKDNGYVSDSYEINIDVVLIKRSTFKVNKASINCVVGDIVICRTDTFSYIGVIETIEENDDSTTLIKTLDFKELFVLEIPANCYTGDLALHIESVINAYYKNNPDQNQNLSYLDVSVETSVFGVLSFDNDSITSVSSLLELISKSYGLNYLTEVVYLRGRITGIKFRIVSVGSGKVVKNNLACLLDVSVSDSSSQLVNKVIYYPRYENEVYRFTNTYYLLKTGDITTDKDDSNRYTSVMCKSYYYSDDDYPTLETKARSEMITSKLDHNITMKLDMNNKVFIPFNNINIGDYVSFIYGNRIYDTILTSINFKNTLSYATITLGEYRVKLTEKLQLLSKNTSSSKTSSTVTVTNNNIDGGEF